MKKYDGTAEALYLWLMALALAVFAGFQANSGLEAFLVEGVQADAADSFSAAFIASLLAIMCAIVGAGVYARGKD